MASTVRPAMRSNRHTSDQYAVYGMSRGAWMMQRDLADWEFAKDKGLPPMFCAVYEDAVRYQAGQIIAQGVR